MSDLREYAEAIAKLQDEVRSIEAQLADKNKTNPQGKRLTGRQYHAWRKNSLRALSMKLSQLREARSSRLAALSALTAGALDLDPSDTESLLRACYVAHEQVKQELGHEAVPESALQVFDLVRDHVLGVA